MIWFRVFILYNQLGSFSLFIFWTIQFLNFGSLIYYKKPFFSLCYLVVFLSTHICTSFINIIFSSSHTCLMGIWLIICVLTLICLGFTKIKMNIVQYLHPFYYNFHKVISNMQYSHIGLINSCWCFYIHYNTHI
jgi:hypothetical protein